MESFKELNDVVSKNDGFKLRLVFKILIDQKLFIEFIESNETGRHYTTARINTIRNG